MDNRSYRFTTDFSALIKPALTLLITLLMSSVAHSTETAASSNFGPLLKAALAHNPIPLQHHLDRGHSLNLHDTRGRSLVLRATMANDMQALRLLIELGADVDYYNPQLSTGVIDQTAFLYAGAKGNNSALKLLISAGARTDIVNYYGGNALIPAAEKGHVDTVKLLLEQSSVDINLVNHLGWTALMEAVLLATPGESQRQIIALLLKHGADTSITDNDGISALEHAQRKNYQKIVALLRRHQ